MRPFIAVMCTLFMLSACSTSMPRGIDPKPPADISGTAAAVKPVEEPARADEPYFSAEKQPADKTLLTAVDPSAGITSMLYPQDAALDEALDFCELAQTLWQKGELENALEALDQAYALILKVNSEDDPDITQQKEDLRFLISKRILEIYASRNIVVNGQHNAIPVDVNSHVQQEIDSFSKGREKKQFIAAYKRSGRYRQFIAAEFKAAGLPEELSWLPLIESGYKTRALSKARALGLWQFIPSTGYKFGLKRDRYIDERLDPYKSTRAAIDYLKELHQIFGDWATVLAAYNCGEGRVLRVIRNQQVNYLDNFWDLYRRLPRETARYVPRFLATLHMVNNTEKYGLDRIVPDPPVEFETISVARRVSLGKIAGIAGTSTSVLKSLNPELRRGILPPERYELKVPSGKADGLLAKIDQIPQTSAPSGGGTYVYHRVRRGETISTIARRYRTNVYLIAQANNLNRRYHIVAGQKLKIPRKGKTVRSKTANVQRKTKNWATRHVVRSGDSLWIIARRYGTTTRKIQQLNGLKGTRLHIGQVLVIRITDSRQALAAADTRSRRYLVQSGDSPFRIATIHNMPLDRLLRINHLSTRSKIYPGQTLLVD